MRVALISDIHGHLTALDAVLADIETRDVDAIVCLGDVATIGPHPREVIGRLGALGCRWVRGNHDAALLDSDKAQALQIADEILPALGWCRSQLAAAELALISASEETISLPIGADQSLLCYHGSPLCSTDCVTDMTPIGTLTAWFAATRESILAGGHTHTQMRRQLDGRTIVNPGSVGCVFRQPPGAGVEVTVQPWAEYCILDAGEGYPGVQMHRVAFDTVRFLRSVEGSDTPKREWWLSQYR